MGTATDSPKLKLPKMKYYYGNVIRQASLIGCAFLLLAIPLDTELLYLYLYGGVFVIFVMVVLAALTNPRVMKFIIADAAISGFLFILFQYLAISGFIHTGNILSVQFILRELIAISFLVSMYYSIKTLRWMYFADKLDDEPYFRSKPKYHELKKQIAEKKELSFTDMHPQ